MDILYYGGIIGIIGFLMFCSVYLKRKFNITKSDYESMILVLEIADYITGEVEFKYQDGVSKIVNYCLQALEVVEGLEKYSDIELKKEVIKEKALEICINEGIDIELGAVEIVDKIVEFIFDNYRQ